MNEEIYTKLEDEPIWVTEYRRGPFVLAVTEGPPDMQVDQTIAPPGGWHTKEDAVVFAQTFAHRNPPYLELRFEIQPLRTPEAFTQFCSWEDQE